MTPPWEDPRRKPVFPAAATAVEEHTGWWPGLDIEQLMTAIRRPLVWPAPAGDPALRRWSA